MGTEVLTNARQDKRTTLNSDYRCDNCGEPAMTREQGHGKVKLRCPSCWLKEQAEKIKPIDRGGYYP